MCFNLEKNKENKPKYLFDCNLTTTLSIKCISRQNEISISITLLILQSTIFIILNVMKCLFFLQSATHSGPLGKIHKYVINIPSPRGEKKRDKMNEHYLPSNKAISLDGYVKGAEQKGNKNVITRCS